jgi:putative transposase
MSRLRRLLISGKIFFVTCDLLPTRLPFVDPDFACLAEAVRGVRTRRAFLLTGYVFMPDHWHALIVPAENDTLPQVMDAVKVASMRRINSRRGTRGALWQPRYFDEITWTVKQYNDTLRYMHFNPLERGLVSRPEDWRWSSFRCFGGSGKIPLEIDRLELPFDDEARLKRRAAEPQPSVFYESSSMGRPSCRRSRSWSAVAAASAFRD